MTGGSRTIDTKKMSRIIEIVVPVIVVFLMLVACAIMSRYRTIKSRRANKVIYKHVYKDYIQKNETTMPDINTTLIEPWES